jgi:ribosome-associated protein
VELEPLDRALRITGAADKRRAEEVVVLDMRGLTTICDYFVICSGRSRPHVDAIAEEVEEQMSALGIEPRHIEGIPDSSWVILDYLDVVVHVFEPDARRFYNLEGLWGDAARVEVPVTEVSRAPQ